MEVRVTVPCTTIANLMCSFVESGDPVTRGWCGGIFHRDEDAEPPPGAWYYENPVMYELADLALKVVETGGDDDEDKHVVHHVDVRRMRKGFRILAEKFPSRFGQVLTGDTDREIADLWMQCVLFGEERYA